MGNFTINQKGYWECENNAAHVHDSNLCVAITTLFKNEGVQSVVDLGCGMGDYAKFFIQNGIVCDAYDGNPNTPTLTNGIGKVLDFSVPFQLETPKYDCVLSLEVGEHIPKEYEQIFIDNLCKHSSKYILLSWAIVGQGGDGHVNCQNNDYVISEMEKRGFVYDEETSSNLRSAVTNAAWFRNTIMLFKVK
jgi:hypothetical protein